MSQTTKGGQGSQDNCMISRTHYSQKESDLRHKLFNISKKRAQETLEKEREEDSKFQINPDSLKSLRDTNSIINAAKNYQKELSSQADSKMGQFIDEMRSQFSHHSGQQSIPQHILYQQTRMLERQVNLLEQNQKTLTDVLNNTVSGGKDGGFMMRQEMMNQNRQMIQDIIAPLNQKCMDMKILYESTKAYADGAVNKIDELKNIVAQSHYMSMHGPMLSSTIGRRPEDPLAEAVGDPTIFKQNLEHIKTQMQEIKDEGLAMEHEMENRLKSMTVANQQRKYLPKSVTEEVEEAKERAKGNPQLLEVLTDYDRSRKAIQDKLGGEFDYSEFEMSIKDLMDEKNKIIADYRETELKIPPPAPIGVPKYNFKTRPLVKKAEKTVPPKTKITVPTQGPSYIAEDPDPIPAIKPNKTQPVGSTNRNPTKKPVKKAQPKDYPEPTVNIHLEEAVEEKKIVDPKTDLLTIKKMVIEDISNDLKDQKMNGKYIDPFKRRDNLETGTDHIVTMGQKRPESEDSKMRNLDRQRHKDEIMAKTAEKNEKLAAEDQEKVVDALTDLILEEYLKYERENKEFEHLTEEEKIQRQEYYREREKVTGFMASLNKSHIFSDSVDPTVKDIGEEIFNEKIDSIFKELEKDKKQQAREKKTFDRQRTIQDLVKSSTMQLDNKGKKKIDFDLDESWEGSDAEETKGKRKPKKSKKKTSTIAEQSQEDSPMKVEHHALPVGAGRPQMGSTQVSLEGNQMPMYAYPPQGYYPVQPHPGFNLGDIQQIVANTIAQEMKRNVNYLEKRNNYPGAPYIQQPEVFATHKIPVSGMSDEEARLRAEENELKKGIPINISPFVQQTLGIDVNRPINAGYNNPFFGGSHPNTGLNPPRLVNLDEYELSSESEFYTEEEDKSISEEILDHSVNTKMGKSRYDIVRNSER